VDTGVGNPHASTADKGETFLKIITEKMASYFVELAAADISDLYEKPSE